MRSLRLAVAFSLPPPRSLSRKRGTSPCCRVGKSPRLRPRYDGYFARRTATISRYSYEGMVLVVRHMTEKIEKIKYPETIDAVRV